MVSRISIGILSQYNFHHIYSHDNGESFSQYLQLWTVKRLHFAKYIVTFVVQKVRLAFCNNFHMSCTSHKPEAEITQGFFV